MTEREEEGCVGRESERESESDGERERGRDETGWRTGKDLREEKERNDRDGGRVLEWNMWLMPHDDLQ